MGTNKATRRRLFFFCWLRRASFSWEENRGRSWVRRSISVHIGKREGDDRWTYDHIIVMRFLDFMTLPVAVFQSLRSPGLSGREKRTPIQSRPLEKLWRRDNARLKTHLDLFFSLVNTSFKRSNLRFEFVDLGGMVIHLILSCETMGDSFFEDCLRDEWGRTKRKLRTRLVSFPSGRRIWQKRSPKEKSQRRRWGREGATHSNVDERRFDTLYLRFDSISFPVQRLDLRLDLLLFRLNRWELVTQSPQFFFSILSNSREWIKKNRVVLKMEGRDKLLANQHRRSNLLPIFLTPFREAQSNLLKFFERFSASRWG